MIFIGGKSQMLDCGRQLFKGGVIIIEGHDKFEWANLSRVHIMDEHVNSETFKNCYLNMVSFESDRDGCFENQHSWVDLIIDESNYIEVWEGTSYKPKGFEYDGGWW